MGFSKGRNPCDAHRIASRDGLKCHYCGKKLTLNHSTGRKYKNFATFEHVKPVSKGGSYSDINNIVLACKDCNNMRGNMDYDEFQRKFGEMMNNLTEKKNQRSS